MPAFGNRTECIPIQLASCQLWHRRAFKKYDQILFRKGQSTPQVALRHYLIALPGRSLRGSLRSESLGSLKWSMSVAPLRKPQGRREAAPLHLNQGLTAMIFMLQASRFCKKKDGFKGAGRRFSDHRVLRPCAVDLEQLTCFRGWDSLDRASTWRRLMRSWSLKPWERRDTHAAKKPLIGNVPFCNLQLRQDAAPMHSILYVLYNVSAFSDLVNSSVSDCSLVWYSVGARNPSLTD